MRRVHKHGGGMTRSCAIDDEEGWGSFFLHLHPHDGNTDVVHMRRILPSLSNIHLNCVRRNI